MLGWRAPPPSEEEVVRRLAAVDRDVDSARHNIMAASAVFRDQDTIARAALDDFVRLVKEIDGELERAQGSIRELVEIVR